MSREWESVTSSLGGKASHNSGGGLMDENDPVVKKLQELAWSLQTLSNKPGGKLPELYKRECHRLTSRAIGLCTNAPYTERSDFMERAEAFHKEIEAKKAEAEGVEKAELDRRSLLCYRAGGDGGYGVGAREDTYFKKAPEKESIYPKEEPPAPRSSIPPPQQQDYPDGGALSSAEIIARCADDPEELFLCGSGVREADIESLCQGLRRGGARLLRLDLSHNDIGDGGIQRLATEIARGTCPKLQELWVGGNSFTELGDRVLDDGLRTLRKQLLVHRVVTNAPKVDPIEIAQKVGADAVAAVVAQGDSDCALVAAELNTHRAAPTASPCSPSAPVVVAPGAEAAEATSHSTGFCSFNQPLAPVEISVVGVGSENLEVLAVVTLPCDIQSAEDVDLDVSILRFVLRRRGATSEGRKVADACLPRAIDPDSTTASFSRRKGTMTLRMRCKPS